MTRPARRVELADARKDSAREIDRLVTTSVGTIHAVVRGDGPDVVLLHGVTDNSHTWHDLQSALAGSARVHAVDLPGHGLSDIPREPLTARRMAHWIAAYLDAADIERAVVVGWSLGGAVAAALSADHAARVSGLVLEAPAVLDFTFPISLWPLRIGGVGEIMYRLAANRSMRRFFMAAAFGRSFAPSDDVMERYWRGWQINGRPRYIRTLLNDFKTTETTPLLGDIRTPAWIVHGDEDQLVPLRVASELEKKLTTAKLFRLNKVGHSPHLERPDVVLDAINEAMRG